MDEALVRRLHPSRDLPNSSGASAHDQERVLDFIESLAGNPFREGDATISDEHGRAVQVKMLSRFVLFYWTDHANKEVRVVDLANADG